jgi:Tfp pilus assembly protein PilF
LVAALSMAVACSQSSAPERSASASRDTRERAYRSNNVGVALLEQLKYPEAAAAFREALTIDASLAIARLNLGLALLYEQDLDGAVREAAEAARLMPEAPQPPYVLGLAARAQNRNDEARRQFERVLQIDPSDVGANVNLAQINLEDRRYDEAIAELRPVVDAEPYHVTAAYVLGLALTRNGNTDEGQPLLERAQELRRVSYAVTFGTGYLEQGRYAEAIASTGAEPELVDTSIPPVRFTAADITSIGGSTASTPPVGRQFSSAELSGAGVRSIAAALGGGQTLADIDGDGRSELITASASGQRIFRVGNGGALTDISGDAGFDAGRSPAVAIGVVAGDVDNDGAVDLVVVRAGTSSLYHNDGKGHFTDITRRARIPAYDALPGAAALVDVDHDGDLDLFIAGLVDIAATRRQGRGPWTFPDDFAPAPLQLLRNNGNGTFTDTTRAAGLDARGHAIAVVPTDFDNHRDIDLLVVNANMSPRLYANQRNGTFRDVAAGVGLSPVARPGERVTSVTTGDVNKDDWPDFFFARTGGGAFALSDGRGRFSTSAAPEIVAGATAAQFVDYDNDGQLDVAALTSRGLVLSRNVGPSWTDVTAATVPPGPAPSPAGGARSLSAADLDGDGDVDLLATSASGGTIWTNGGDSRNRALQVRLRGRVTNRSGVGSKVQVRAGSLSARAETSAATPPAAPSDVLFGLGARPGAEVVRVLWPSGILQAETATAQPATPQPAGAQPAGAPGAVGTLPSPFVVEELDRKPSSCPFLFVWNGERFEFVTDFLGGGEMGYWEGPGAYNHPDPVEYVRIPNGLMKPVDARLQLRVTNELEEVLYLDRLRLLAVAHPADLQVYPNEGMPAAAAKPFRLHAVADLRTPVRVVDDLGRDVRDRVARLDRRYPDGFTLSRIRGYADPHALTIDIGPASYGRTLLLTGWTDYAFSSDNVAASQAGLTALEPALDVREASGRWRRLDLAIGIPVGRPQTIPVDLSGLLRPGEHELRLTTNMRIYWDQIQVGRTMPADAFTISRLEPKLASLRERGFSAEVRPDGEDPPTYDYARVSSESPWKVFAGAFTRTGDVLPLLGKSDDRFVIAKTGDEVALEFDAPAAELPAGWTRTYLLYGDGFSKEMDVNSASPDTVEPLPFHGMSRYPYPSTEQYPDTPEHREYRDQFNTRRIVRPVPMLKGAAQGGTTR